MSTQHNPLWEAGNSQRELTKTQHREQLQRNLEAVARTLHQAYEKAELLEMQLYSVYGEHHLITKEGRQAQAKLVMARGHLSDQWNRRFPIAENPFVSNKKEG